MRVIISVLLITLKTLVCCYAVPPDNDLVEAVEKDDVARATQLIASGADVNIFVGNAQDPLLGLVKSVAMFNCLILKTEVNRVSPDTGKSALYLAVERDNIDLVKCLILVSADVNAKDRAGKTPLTLARETNREEIAAILKWELDYVTELTELNKKNSETGVSDAPELSTSQQIEAEVKKREARIKKLEAQESELKNQKHSNYEAQSNAKRAADHEQQAVLKRAEFNLAGLY